MRSYIKLVAVISATIFPCKTMAQTTGGVFGPNISAGDKSGQFRMAYAPGQDGGFNGWEARMHYQQALSDEWRWRLVLQGSNREDSRFESNFIQAEIQYQFQKKSSTYGWASALRLDARLVEKDDGKNRLGLGWTNQWNPDSWQNWQFNNVILTAAELGDNAANGIFVEVRNGVKYRLDGGAALGLESFHTLGNSNNLGSFNRQNHRLGPVITGKISKNVSYLAGALFGLSEPARNIDIRLWLGRKF